jgi:hypothetical protein
MANTSYAPRAKSAQSLDNKVDILQTSGICLCCPYISLLTSTAHNKLEVSNANHASEAQEQGGSPTYPQLDKPATPKSIMKKSVVAKKKPAYIPSSTPKTGAKNVTFAEEPAIRVFHVESELDQEVSKARNSKLGGWPYESER